MNLIMWIATIGLPMTHLQLQQKPNISALINTPEYHWQHMGGSQEASAIATRPWRLLRSCPFPGCEGMKQGMEWRGGSLTLTALQRGSLGTRLMPTCVITLERFVGLCCMPLTSLAGQPTSAQGGKDLVNAQYSFCNFGM